MSLLFCDTLCPDCIIYLSAPLRAPQMIIISLDYGRSAKQGEDLKHAGQKLPYTVQVKVQAVHSASPGAQITSDTKGN